MDSGIVGLFFVLGIVIVLITVVLLGGLPGAIARHRGHPNATAVSVCGWVGIFVWPAWWVALIWAYTGPDNSKDTRAAQQPKYQRGFDPIPASFQPSRRVDPTDAEVALALGEETSVATEALAQIDVPGLFEIVGVDRASKMDTTWRVRADNTANAKVKAELEGIVVTSIKRVS